ncbi:MAG TPA: DUF4870 domain-containing protein [Pyrinomonadaceae bacterium]|nr:DUF4870 domain-containing protein [Pyrinomonadaceae bacterium]
MSYPQPNYGAPPAGPTGKSSIGLDGNVASAIGYPIGILALVLAIIEKENRFVRFHAIQSLLYAVVATVLLVVLGILSTIVSIVAVSISETLGGLVGLVVWLLYFGVILAYFGGLILAAIKAYQGQWFKLPVVGNFAEKFAR